MSTIKNFTSSIKLWVVKLIANFALQFIHERINELPLGWNLELITRCAKAYSVEIHDVNLPKVEVDKVFLGCFIQGRLKSIEFRNGELFLILDNDMKEYCIKQVSQPHFIDEDGWDCMWCGFPTGHVVFYFKPKPETN